MSQTAAGCQQNQKWYNRNVFPLIPLITARKSDEHNTGGFTFRWLCFTFWTLDAFEFEIALNASTHWGVGITFLLPYLRGVIAIPCPEKLSILIDRKLGRRPKKHRI